MKVVYGFDIPTAIYERMDNVYSIKNCTVFVTKDSDFVIVGEMLKNIDSGMLMLDSKFTHELDAFATKERIEELTFMKALESVLKKWVKAYEILREETALMNPDFSEEELTDYLIDFNLPEKLNLGWYVIEDVD